MDHRERSKRQQPIVLPFLTDVFTVDWGTHYPATAGARLCKTYLLPCMLIIIQGEKTPRFQVFKFPEKLRTQKSQKNTGWTSSGRDSEMTAGAVLPNACCTAQRLVVKSLNMDFKLHCGLCPAHNW